MINIFHLYILNVKVLQQEITEQLVILNALSQLLFSSLQEGNEAKIIQCIFAFKALFFGINNHCHFIFFNEHEAL